MNGQRHVIVVGGGFAGIGCVRKLARHGNVRVTLIARNNYHQFQPLLYQVATCQLAPSDIAYSLRQLFHEHPNVDVKLDQVVAVDPETHTVTAADGRAWTGDAVVLAAGSVPNFFRTPGADVNSFPLYSLDDAERLRSRILRLFEDADRDPGLIDRGALNFVVVGGGPTGVEVAGAFGDMIHETMSIEYRDLAVAAAQVHLVDIGHALLSGFSNTAHDYAANVLRRKGVHLHMGVAVSEVAPDHVKLADGTTIPTHCVVWGGGLMAAPVTAAPHLQQGSGGRIDVRPDLTVDGTNGVYAVGDIANIPGPDGHPFPQLGSVALHSGTWAAGNILADFTGNPRRPFRYRDKGIMAMIGRGAAIAEVGAHRRELHGVVAFAAWLGVHAVLMTGVRNRIHALVNWSWDYFSKTRGPQVLDRSDAARIDWGPEPNGSPTPSRSNELTRSPSTD
jgi:NADH:ubiquinone reductase (H+-translocating)